MSVWDSSLVRRSYGPLKLSESVRDAGAEGGEA